MDQLHSERPANYGVENPLGDFLFAAPRKSTGRRYGSLKHWLRRRIASIFLSVSLACPTMSASGATSAQWTGALRTAMLVARNGPIRELRMSTWLTIGCEIGASLILAGINAVLALALIGLSLSLVLTISLALPLRAARGQYSLISKPSASRTSG
jgi:hypothetical protein